MTSQSVAKRAQENRVASIFVPAWTTHHSFDAAVASLPPDDPPDLLITSNRKTWGIEFIEVDQLYAARSFYVSFTEAFTKEFARRKPVESYAGLSIELCVGLSVQWRELAISGWHDCGLGPAKGMRQAASQLTELITSTISTAYDVPNDDNGFYWKIQGDSRYRALACISPLIVARRIAADQPMTIVKERAFVIHHGEAMDYLIRKLNDKIDGIKRWEPCDSRILVVHDIPRIHEKHEFSMLGVEFAAHAGRAANVGDYFDEFWFAELRPRKADGTICPPEAHKLG